MSKIVRKTAYSVLYHLIFQMLILVFTKSVKYLILVRSYYVVWVIDTKIIPKYFEIL